MRGFLTDIAGTIASAAVMAVGAALWNTAFAPLWEVSPKRFALTCIMAALIGAGIACSITLTVGRKRRTKDAQRIKELDGRVKELTKMADADAGAAREIAERRAAMARRLMGLPDDMMYFVWVARLDGRLSTDHRNEAAVALSGRGVLVDVSESKGFTTKWVLSEDAEAAMDDTEVSDAVRAGHGRWEEKLAEKRLDERERAFRDLSMEQRLFAYRVWRDGSADLDEYNARDLDSGFLVREDMGGGRFRYRLAPESVELFSEREGSCFATVIEEIERRGIDG